MVTSPNYPVQIVGLVSLSVPNGLVKKETTILMKSLTEKEKAIVFTCLIKNEYEHFLLSFNVIIIIRPSYLR